MPSLKQILLILTLWIGSVLAGPGAWARVLMVSDIDDTIKIANVRNKLEAAGYALNSEIRFYGMAEVYQQFAAQTTDLDIVYLSRAPAWLLGSQHRRFLSIGEFPQGTYIPRSDQPAETHKLFHLRRLIEEKRPDQVVLIGDDTEIDFEVYQQIRQEYLDQKIEFFIFIRVISDQDLKISAGVPAQRFLTSVDLAWKMNELGLLSSQSLTWVEENLLPSILAPGKIGDFNQVPIPHFVRCASYSWSAPLQHNSWSQLESFFKKRCQSSASFLP